MAAPAPFYIFFDSCLFSDGMISLGNPSSMSAIRPLFVGSMRPIIWR
jgi:hypothetical protein